MEACNEENVVDLGLSWVGYLENVQHKKKITQFLGCTHEIGYEGFTHDRSFRLELSFVLGPTRDGSKIRKHVCNAIKGAQAVRLQRNKMMREQKRLTLLKEKRASSRTRRSLLYCLI
nr:pre-rRNA-processing protein TSR1 homolog [Tanacetum cinerariifolium]